jgi:hypothetical protein
MMIKTLKNMLLLVGMTASVLTLNMVPAHAMTVSELAEYARNASYNASDPVIAEEQSPSGCRARYTLVDVWRLQGDTLAGIVRYSDCPLMTYTYFEMDGTNRNSVSVFTEVAAGRSTQFANWAPSSNPGESYDWELLQIVGDAMMQYAP